MDVPKTSLQSTVSIKIQTKYKDRLKYIAGRKGISIGEAIEEMIEVYEIQK